MKPCCRVKKFRQSFWLETKFQKSIDFRGFHLLSKLLKINSWLKITHLCTCKSVHKLNCKFIQMLHNCRQLEIFTTVHFLKMTEIQTCVHIKICAHLYKKQPLTNYTSAPKITHLVGRRHKSFNDSSTDSCILKYLFSSTYSQDSQVKSYLDNFIM